MHDARSHGVRRVGHKTCVCPVTLQCVPLKHTAREGHMTGPCQSQLPRPSVNVMSVACCLHAPPRSLLPHSLCSVLDSAVMDEHVVCCVCLSSKRPPELLCMGLIAAGVGRHAVMQGRLFMT